MLRSLTGVHVVAALAAAVTSVAVWSVSSSRAGGGHDASAAERPARLEATTAAEIERNLSKQDFQRTLGAVIFRKTWIAAPASTDSSDGLGPLYNARACSDCHPRGGRGRPPSADVGAERSPGLVMRLSMPPATLAERQRLTSGEARAIPEPTYGLQLQTHAIQGHHSEGRLRVAHADLPVVLADGTRVILRQPMYDLETMGYGPLHPDTMQSPRLAPALLGLGLLESVPATEILAFEDPEDRDGDGISGRASHVGPVIDGGRAIGRFGWKAGTATVRAQVAEAFSIDLGISSSLQPQPAGDCTPRQTLCRSAPDGRSTRHGGHEISDVVLDLVTGYVAGITPAHSVSRPGLDLGQGQRLFELAQCALCHRPGLSTGEGLTDTRSDRQTIKPYTDLLLHDMGAGLADHRPEGSASGSEWRTAPLWGIGQNLDADGRGHLLHDGRARTIEEAILWHGGEARGARDAFAALPRVDRNRLIEFVKSL